eukprot:scaffold323075_cov27-Prasinocladus_malaysianus.AAC.1
MASWKLIYAAIIMRLQARVNIPDDRFKWLCDQYKPKSQVPAFLEVVDIAGLVKGAAEGQGLGNAFLSNISVSAEAQTADPSCSKNVFFCDTLFCVAFMQFRELSEM